MSAPEILFDLAAPRTIALTDRNHTFLLNCRRITSHDWSGYFAAIVITSEQSGKSRINVFDVQSARQGLAEAVLTKAVGYKVAGDIDLCSLESWQKKIPIAHRLRLGEALCDVRASEADDEFMIHPESEVVSLDATWTSSARLAPSGDGYIYTMQKLQGLKHFLQSPTQEQHTRYKRESSRSMIVGGSRTGKTIYMGAQLLLAKLYDELVVSVDGYSIGERPLTDDRSEIVREMDMLHKVIAAQELFHPSESVSLTESQDVKEGEIQ